MSVPTRVVHKRRATVTDLPLYYSGHLLKKLSKEKDFKKYYGELRGATLFLYKDDTQDTYTEKLDLEKLTSMELDSPYQRKAPTIFTLTLHTEVVQLKMDNSDTGEEWRGYILTVVKKKIPSKLQLLPGQMLLLQEALDQERKRKPPIARPPLPPRPSFLPSPSASPFRPLPKEKPSHNSPDIPACFYSVTRQEAEQMLEANPENGGIILRPSTLANNYALTLRQLTPSGPVMKNYRVASTNSGFVIELDTAVMVASLNDVLKYFIEKTEYRLHPYMASQPYDTRIDVSPAPKCVSITSPTPKTIPKAQVAPMLRSQNKVELLQPPTKEEGEYVIPDDPSPDHNLRLVQLDGELRDVLKFRRENMYTASDKEEVTIYENQTTGKSPSGTAQWATWSAAV
ncbi:signal-transducing adaptor protein 1 [Etheostoma spectabile]|uniref:signal-transducing adaptor protein 1 n=1 Tax=Etheostoma spectabile TaxID=54343 RepID=UPI0013AF6E1F|nr:signal-transducing adaptor protein 1-like [Etheostoma spectabile]XP_032383107.1 signal-transducing adaptor protein 1-like [Etheostoma spectabile]